MQNDNKNKLSRRNFVKQTSALAIGSVALSSCNAIDLDEFSKKNFKTLSKAEKDKLILDLEKKYSEKYFQPAKLSK